MYDTQITIFRWGYKPTNITGGGPSRTSYPYETILQRPGPRPCGGPCGGPCCGIVSSTSCKVFCTAEHRACCPGAGRFQGPRVGSSWDLFNISIYIYTYIYIYIHVYIYIYFFFTMYIYIYVSMYVRTYVYAYIYIWRLSNLYDFWGIYFIGLNGI